MWLYNEGSCIAVHVDDMAAVGTISLLQFTADHLGKYMEMQDFGDISKYLGMSIRSHGDGFLLDQEEYILSLVEEYRLQQAHDASTPMLTSDRDTLDRQDSTLLDDHGKRKYQSLVGSLLYLVHGTRPDISFAIIKLSQYSSCPRVSNWNSLNRVLHYLKATSGASLRIGFDGSNAGLVAYFDAALTDNENRRSTCGYVFLLHGSPISLATKVQRTVALSTTEAEFMAGTEATKEAMFIQQVTNALFRPQLAPAELRGDNQGALALAINPVYHERTKHIDIRQRYISEMVNLNAISVKYVHTSHMLADGFTKPLSKERVMRYDDMTV